LNFCPVTVLAVRQTTMAQMSSQTDTNALLAAAVHGKGLKPSQPSTSSSSQPPVMPDQRMPIPSGPPGYFSLPKNFLFAGLPRPSSWCKFIM